MDNQTKFDATPTINECSLKGHDSRIVTINTEQHQTMSDHMTPCDTYISRLESPIMDKSVETIEQN